MNVLLSAAVGSAATHVFDHTLPGVYKKGNEILGRNVFTTLDEAEEIEDDEELNYIIDPEVGFLIKDSKLGYSLRGKGGPTPKLPIEEVKEEVKKEVIEDMSIYEPRILDYVSYASVTLLILYTSYKVIELSRNNKYDNIFDN